MGAAFTGLLDNQLRRIHEGDMIWAGMRRGDMSGWSLERVVRGCGDEPWLLENLKGERMQMQWDQNLRLLDEYPKEPPNDGA